MPKLKFQIVTPERTVLQEEVDSLTCPTQMGQITILPNHIPLIASLQAGELVARVDSRVEHIAVSGGFVEIRPGNEIVILADTAEMAEEIDPARAEEAKQRAEAAMKEETVRSSEEYATIVAAVERNKVRLKVARRKSPKHHIHLNEDSNS
jgi:F-type H+-transporting ATPase subunit epsilon